MTPSARAAKSRLSAKGVRGGINASGPGYFETKQHGGGGIGTVAWKLTHSVEDGTPGGFLNPDPNYSKYRRPGT